MAALVIGDHSRQANFKEKYCYQLLVNTNRIFCSGRL